MRETVRRTLTAVLAALVLTVVVPLAASAAGGIKTAIPPLTDNNSATFWKAVMEEFNGTYSRKHKCWARNYVGENQGNICMRPWKLDIVQTRMGERLFVATGGSKIGNDGRLVNCHACSGWMGLFILQPTQDGYVLEAHNGYVDAQGAWGAPSPEEHFDVRAIGGPYGFGWVIGFGYTAQGYTSGGVEIHSPLGDRIRDLGFIGTFENDLGNCDDNGKNLMSGEGCTDITAEVDFLPADREFHDVIVRETGTKTGEPHNQTRRIPFDESAFQYKDPQT